MNDAAIALNLITAWWKSKLIHTAVLVGAFDSLEADSAQSADDVASKIDVDPTALYRLLRALGTIGVVNENSDSQFTVTELGKLFRSDNPSSLRQVALLEAGRELPAVWNHLPDVVRTGKGTGADREFGKPIWEHLKENSDLAGRFDDAMSSYSHLDAIAVRTALKNEDFGGSVLCDVGGGHGTLLASVLKLNPGASGIVLEVADVVKRAVATGLADRHRRISFLDGDMFERVPTADVYFLKHILHDWQDSDCIKILQAITTHSKAASRLFLCEWVVPEPQQPHFSKIVDIHMMVVTRGQERTQQQYAKLLKASGWRLVNHLSAPDAPMSVLEAVKS